jgi:hypothetical protein
MESEYDRLTRRSFEAKQRLDRAEEAYRNPGNTGVGNLAIARMRRDRALQEYLEIEAERKRAAPPPPPAEPEPDG